MMLAPRRSDGQSPALDRAGGVNPGEGLDGLLWEYL